MKTTKLFLCTIFCSLLFVSCTDTNPVSEEFLGNYEKGIFILNEGAWGGKNASVSFLSSDFNQLVRNAFLAENTSMELGDVGQDIGFYKDLAYIVLNGSNKIEVVNRYTMKHVTTISSGLKNPRYIVFFKDSAYVTNWGDGTDPSDDYVAVISLSENNVTDTISVVEGPEKLILKDTSLYVAHHGGWGFGNSISVINCNTNTVLTKIEVGDIPNSLEVSNNNLYVLCGGKPNYSKAETTGSLVKVDLINNKVTSKRFFSGIVHPSNLYFEGGSGYYTVGLDVFKYSLSEDVLPSQSFFSASSQGVKSISDIAVKNDKIYIADAGDFTNNSNVYVYSINGSLLKEIMVGVGPNGFYFNN